MKAPDFYANFGEYDHFLKDAGFKKKSKNKYVNNGQIEIGIALDRWGWDSECGWGFLVRMSDMNGVDSSHFERPRRMKDIRFSSLVEEGLMDEDERVELYRPLVRNHPRVYDQTNMWFAFYDSEDLKKLLEKIMPLVAVAANAWSKESRV
jgi:hypothetical protein